MRGRRLRLRRGFTLLEAAVAMAIVGVIALAALGAYAAELRAAGKARQALPAVSLAEERLAAIDLLPAGELRALPDSLARGRFGPPFERYEWTATVRRAREAGRGMRGLRDLYDVRVEVRWPEGLYTLDARRYRPLPAETRMTRGGAR